MAKILVAGSLAFDQIMDYPGDFKDHIHADKLHVISISFLVETLTRKKGGCAGNIGYTLSLLGESPRIVGAAGADFSEYQTYLDELGCDTGGIQIFSDETTASAFITTDKADNQIIGFHPGAMKRARELSLAASKDDDTKVCIVSPDDPEAMTRHCHEARESDIELFYDPSFQVTAMDGDFLWEGAAGARGLFLNDYEWAVFQEKTKKKPADVLQDVEFVVVTLGEKGCEIHRRDEHVTIAAAKAGDVVDPTGAGDAFRGGFLAGYVRGYDLPDCARMGSVAAVYAIEKHGTQEHHYTVEEFNKRHAEAYGAAPT